MSNPAQEEFDALVSRNSKHSSSKHRYDNDSDLDDASTLAPSSIHSSTLSHSKPGKHASSRSMRSARSGKSIRSNKSTSGNSFYQDSSDEDTPEEPKKPSTYYLPQSYHREAMTGPKGVIADAAAFEQEKRGGRNNDQFSRTRDLALPKVQRHGGVSPGPGRKGSDDARALDGIDEDSENEALVRWREQRVRELKGAMHNGARGGRKKYGVLETVDGMGFLEAVEKAGRGATVVVYIYDDQSALSNEFDAHLSKISSKHTATQFVALHCDDAEIDSAGVPAIIAYRNGEKFASLVPLVDEVSLARDVQKNLEQVLHKHQII